MKRVEAWHILHELWGGATPEQKEALGIAMDDIEFVDLMRGHGVPLTNAQHIRSMSDEELAAEIVLLHTTCEVCAKNEMCGEMLGIAMCVEGVKDWLKKPYKEDEHG